MTTVSLKDVCTFFSDGDWIESKDQSDDGIRLIQTGNVGHGVFKDRIEKARWISEETFKKLRCKEILQGDVLISRLPDPVGRSCLLPALEHKAITAVDCSIVRFNEEIMDARFFVYYSQSSAYALAIAPLISGATRQRISREKLGTIQVPLFSLEKQGEIVEELDSAFAEIDLLEGNLNFIDSLIVECDNSILERILAPNDEHIVTHISSTLGEVSELISRGISPSYLDTANTFVLNQRCIRDGRVNFDFARRHNEKTKKVQEAKLLRDGDGLINSTGVGTLGRTALFKKNVNSNFTVDSHVTIVRPKSEILNSDYFGLVLKALETVFISLSTGTSGQTELPREAVRDTSITFPVKLADQVDFYKYYNSINFTLSESKKLVSKRKSLVSFLRNSLLSNAFKHHNGVT